MKKKIFALLFCLVFCLICVTPLAVMAIRGPSEAGANEVLSSAPGMKNKDGSWNWDYLSDLTTYFGDRFGLRQELITAHAKLNALLFGESATEDVILGSDGWLYYADTLADYEGTSAMTERQLWSAARTLYLMQEYAQKRGADFVFTITPNKNTLYPEYMPERYARSDEPSNLARLQQLLTETGVAYCDLYALFAEEAQPVYYRTDSHWNGYGSALAHDALLTALGREAALAEESFANASHLGDLTEMLYPAAEDYEQGPMLERERTYSYVGTVRGADDMTIRTTSNAEDSLLMFRDSFGNLLHEDLAESFAFACFSRAMPYNLTYLERENADTLIVELVERNLIWLAEKPPVMQGPVRELALPTETVSAQVEWEVETCNVEGCVRYVGTIDCAEMDETSPIYLTLDGTIYEATPAGAGETAFCLYAPEASEITVLIECDGVLYQCK